MSETLVVVVDGVSQLEYARATSLTPAQRDYLDRLDQNMDSSIELGGQRIDAPNPLQRAQFVALQLLQAVQAGNEAVAAATCAYLANRIPDLKQVRASTRAGLLSFDLVFDKAFAKEVKVEFMRPQTQD
ncbi:MAG: hypothetical protein HZB57_04075 [Gammaproteobacteria bacterium]|nr:hypothetical protein [Gammaproteobacteria bacterium]